MFTASMLDADGHNIFGGGKRPPDVGSSAVAGLLKTIAGIVAFLFINTWNGFRRITPGSYAPTSRGLGRKTTVPWPCAFRFRTTRTGASNTVLPGPTPIPISFSAALLQGMTEGIDAGDPPPPAIEGNAYDEDGLALPGRHGRDALQLMERGRFVDRALGPELAKIYKDLKRAEIMAFWSEINAT